MVTASLPQAVPAARRGLVPVLVLVAMVVSVGSSLGAPLIPMISDAYRVPLAAAQWVLTVTFLVSAVATPLMGRLGDGPHRRAVIIAALAAVTAGGILAAIPLGFAALLTGRGLQGIGLGLIPLTIAAARDALPAEKARSASAVLSITAVAGIGLGYPITGLIAHLGGVHAAFWFGAAVSAAALLCTVLVVPASTRRTRIRVDLPGAALLGAGLAGVLLALSEGTTWGWGSPALIGTAASSVLLLALWVLVELRTPHPLINLRLLRNPSVLTADTAAALTGIGMYLLIASVARLVQTPASTGYGLGQSVTIAGLALLPFSIGSVLASRIAPPAGRRLPPGVVLALGALTLVASMTLFTLARTQLWEIFLTMTLAGVGIGSIYALIPGLILRGVPHQETGSAMSFNQVLRYVGYGAGSTLGAVILQQHNTPGTPYPANEGYTIVGLAAIGVWTLTAAICLTASIRRPGRAIPPSEADLDVLETESVALAVPDEDAAGSGSQARPL